MLFLGTLRIHFKHKFWTRPHMWTASISGQKHCDGGCPDATTEGIKFGHCWHVFI